MNKTPPVVITGTTTTFKPDGTKQESYSSPRITLDAHGDVVLEERLSTTGVLVLRRHLGRDQRVEDEDHFTPDGALDYRIAYRYDGSGRIAEEIMNFGDGTPHGRWVHHRDPHGRLLDRELIHPDGRSEVTETYRYTANGRSATATRGRVGQWTYEYDADGRVVRKQGGPISGDEMDLESIEYRYDDRHRLVREATHYPGGRIKSEIVITYP